MTTIVLPKTLLLPWAEYRAAQADCARRREEAEEHNRQLYARREQRLTAYREQIQRRLPDSQVGLTIPLDDDPTPTCVTLDRASFQALWQQVFGEQLADPLTPDDVLGGLLSRLAD